MNDMQDLENKLKTLDEIFKNSIKGDIVIVDCYKGEEILAIISKLANYGIYNKLIHVFDPFSGIPVRIGNKIHKNISLKSQVENLVHESGYPKDNIHYHLNYGIIPQDIAYLSINTYSYKRTCEAIMYFKPYINNQTKIYISKYGSFSGCTDAVNEHLENINFEYSTSSIQISTSNSSAQHSLFNKVIVWGFPLHTHSHSYIHACWVKAFKYLGYDTYWFSDDNYEQNFDYTNCLFITEGYADFKIPLHKSNIYYVHVCVDPQRYLDAGVRFIDMRYNKSYNNDVNYEYNLDESLKQGKAQQISSVTYYEDLEYYPAIYTSWATDLLPSEFDFTLSNIDTENTVYFVGSAGPHHNALIQALYKHNINFVHIDCWKNPISFEDNIKLMQKSIINVDLRHDFHKNVGYIPCRVFKAISYGKIGITNSKRVQKLFGENNIIYHDNVDILVDMALQNKDNKELLLRQMKYVQENHTYLNRIDDLLNCLNKAFVNFITYKQE
jgi:hypothetical protein